MDHDELLGMCRDMVLRLKVLAKLLATKPQESAPVVEVQLRELAFELKRAVTGRSGVQEARNNSIRN